MEVHGNVGEWGLETDPRWDIDVKNKFLEGLFYLFVIQVIVAHKGGEERVKVGNCLGTGCFTL